MNLADIRLWHIHFAPDCRHTLPDPKDKLVIVVGIEADTIFGFLINSYVHPFIESKPNLLVCQAYLTMAQHPCLIRDSSIDCRNAFQFKAGEFEGIRDRVHPDALLSIFNSVHACKVLLDEQRNMIRASAKAYLGL